MQANAADRKDARVMSVRAAAKRLQLSAWLTRNAVTRGDLVGVQQVGPGFSRLLITEASVNALVARWAAEPKAAA